ncbi:MAG TPA: hypothetical protein VJT13_20980 [Xanthobacteraceae bacterium]|nr:hypothetical protein [Xanthobacteraceae bacterium]
MIGTSDDALAADGAHTFSFGQALTRARKLVEGRRAGTALTVKDAIEGYVADREKAELGRKRDARSRLGRYVLTDELSKKALNAIVASDLKIVVRSFADASRAKHDPPSCQRSEGRSEPGIESPRGRSTTDATEDSSRGPEAELRDGIEAAKRSDPLRCKAA